MKSQRSHLKAFYHRWVDVPDWKDAGAYVWEFKHAGKAATECTLQWYGVEFARRGKEFRTRLSEFLMTVPRAEWPKYDVAARGAKTLFAPTDECAKALFPEWPKLRPGLRFASADDLGRNGIVPLAFDLYQPIKEQLERAGEMLREWQEGHVEEGVIAGPDGGRHHRKLFPLYLRALDAVEKGATDAMFADHISKERHEALDEGDVKNWLRAARKYRDTDFVQLLAIPF
jgi:hypothetical protein